MYAMVELLYCTVLSTCVLNQSIYDPTAETDVWDNQECF
jgi:hypothetical protein